MRILYILSGTGLRDGSTKSFLAMADAVAAAGHEVAVVVPDDNGVVPLLKDRDWTVLAVPYMFATLPYLSWNPSELAKFLPRLLKALTLNRKARKTVETFAEKWHPDIVHDNTSVTDLGHFAALKAGAAHLVHIREYGWRDFRRIIPGLKKRLSAPRTYVAAITSDLADFRGKNLDPGHLRVIYNGVVSASVEEYDPVKSPWFLYAGRIREGKGVADLIEAYIAYADGILASGGLPVGLKLAGACDDPGFHESMSRRIRNEGLEKYVEWLGECDSVASLYRKAVATIIPSRSEGFGRVMPEAMAAGSLCVARDEGGLSEQLKNGRHECGEDIAFGYSSVGQLADILKKIGNAYRDGAAYREGGDFFHMISDSREVVVRLYSYEAHAKAILDYYSKIINSQ